VEIVCLSSHDFLGDFGVRENGPGLASSNRMNGRRHVSLASSGKTSRHQG